MAGLFPTEDTEKRNGWSRGLPKNSGSSAFRFRFHDFYVSESPSSIGRSVTEVNRERTPARRDAEPIRIQLMSDSAVLTFNMATVVRTIAFNA